MDEVNSIERYRKRRKRQQNRRRITALTVLLVIAAILYFTADWWVEAFRINDVAPVIAMDGSTVSGFPIQLTSSAEYEMKPTSDGLAVLTDTYLYTYEQDGSRKVSYQHNARNPVMQTANRRVLLYDKDGYDLLVHGRSEIVYEKTLTQKIILGRISSDNHVAIVTESSRFYGEMLVFDSRGNEIFAWYSDHEILDIAFTDSGDGCVVSTLTASGGRLLTRLYCFDFSQEEPLWQRDIAGVMLYDLQLRSNNGLYAVGDNAAALLSSEGAVEGTYTYPAELTGFSVSSDLLTLDFYDIRNRSFAISTITKDATAPATIELEGEIRDVSSGEDRVCLLLPNRLLVYSSQLEQITAYDLDNEAEQVMESGSYYYVLGSNSIARIKK